jgi:hypothetical protein
MHDFVVNGGFWKSDIFQKGTRALSKNIGVMDCKIFTAEYAESYTAVRASQVIRSRGRLPGKHFLLDLNYVITLYTHLLALG